MTKPKGFSAEQIIMKLREAEVLLSQGQTVKHLCRALEVSEQTYYRWRREMEAALLLIGSGVAW